MIRRGAAGKCRDFPRIDIARTRTLLAVIATGRGCLESAPRRARGIYYGPDVVPRREYGENVVQADIEEE